MARKKTKAAAAPTKKPTKGVPAKSAAAKKTKNIFKVADTKTNQKRPREVKVQLKRMKETISKVDEKFNTIHKDMVVKKVRGQISPKKSPAATKKAPANTKKVQKKIGKMKV